MNDIVKVKKIRDSLTYHRRPEETFSIRFLPHGDRLFGDVQDLVNHHSHTAVAVVENDDLDRIGLVVVGTAGLQHVSERHEAEDAVPVLHHLASARVLDQASRKLLKPRNQRKRNGQALEGTGFEQE